MKIVAIIALLGLLTACGRSEGVFNPLGTGYQVFEVRPGLTCVFVNGTDGGVSCVAGSFPQ